jgi:hypothetical protein
MTRFASEANVHRRENDYGAEKIAKTKNTPLHKEFTKFVAASSRNQWETFDF